jgi:hypothetical protein
MFYSTITWITHKIPVEWMHKRWSQQPTNFAKKNNSMRNFDANKQNELLGYSFDTCLMEFYSCKIMAKFYRKRGKERTN